MGIVAGPRLAVGNNGNQLSELGNPQASAVERRAASTTEWTVGETKWSLLELQSSAQMEIRRNGGLHTMECMEQTLTGSADFGKKVTSIIEHSRCEKQRAVSGPDLSGKTLRLLGILSAASVSGETRDTCRCGNISTTSRYHRRAAMRPREPGERPDTMVTTRGMRQPAGCGLDGRRILNDRMQVGRSKPERLELRSIPFRRKQRLKYVARRGMNRLGTETLSTRLSSKSSSQSSR